MKLKLMNKMIAIMCAVSISSSCLVTSVGAIDRREEEQASRLLDIAGVKSAKEIDEVMSFEAQKQSAEALDAAGVKSAEEISESIALQENWDELNRKRVDENNKQRDAAKALDVAGVKSAEEISESMALQENWDELNRKRADEIEKRREAAVNDDEDIARLLQEDNDDDNINNNDEERENAERIQNAFRKFKAKKKVEELRNAKRLNVLGINKLEAIFSKHGQKVGLNAIKDKAELEEAKVKLRAAEKLKDVLVKIGPKVGLDAIKDKAGFEEAKIKVEAAEKLQDALVKLGQKAGLNAIKNKAELEEQKFDQEVFDFVYDVLNKEINRVNEEISSVKKIQKAFRSFEAKKKVEELRNGKRLNVLGINKLEAIFSKHGQKVGLNAIKDKAELEEAKVKIRAAEKLKDVLVKIGPKVGLDAIKDKAGFEEAKIKVEAAEKLQDALVKLGQKAGLNAIKKVADDKVVSDFVEDIFNEAKAKEQQEKEAKQIERDARIWERIRGEREGAGQAALNIIESDRLKKENAEKIQNAFRSFEAKKKVEELRNGKRLNVLGINKLEAIFSKHGQKAGLNAIKDKAELEEAKVKLGAAEKLKDVLVKIGPKAGLDAIKDKAGFEEAKIKLEAAEKLQDALVKLGQKAGLNAIKKVADGKVISDFVGDIFNEVKGKEQREKEAKQRERDARIWERIPGEREGAGQAALNIIESDRRKEAAKKLEAIFSKHGQKAGLDAIKEEVSAEKIQNAFRSFKAKKKVEELKKAQKLEAALVNVGKKAGLDAIKNAADNAEMLKEEQQKENAHKKHIGKNKKEKILNNKFHIRKMKRKKELKKAKKLEAALVNIGKQAGLDAIKEAVNKKKQQEAIQKLFERKANQENDMLERVLRDWDSKAKKLNEEAAKKRIAKWIENRYKTSEARKGWNKLKDGLQKKDMRELLNVIKEAAKEEQEFDKEASGFVYDVLNRAVNEVQEEVNAKEKQSNNNDNRENIIVENANEKLNINNALLNKNKVSYFNNDTFLNGNRENIIVENVNEELNINNALLNKNKVSYFNNDTSLNDDGENIIEEDIFENLNINDELANKNNLRYFNNNRIQNDYDEEINDIDLLDIRPNRVVKNNKENMCQKITRFVKNPFRFFFGKKK